MRIGFLGAGKMATPVVARLLACLAGAGLLGRETHHG
jgi:3-hydroxyisobutyrate dehydrogenase-like beta-hydroxyacid dehydrogenase